MFPRPPTLAKVGINKGLHNAAQPSQTVWVSTAIRTCISFSGPQLNCSERDAFSLARRQRISIANGSRLPAGCSY